MIAIHHLPYPFNIDLSTSVEGLWLLELFFTSSGSPLNFLCHSKTDVSNKVLSPYIYWSISSTWDSVFPYWTQNFWFIYSSVLIADQPEKEEL